MLIFILLLIALVCSIRRTWYSRLTAQDIPPGVEVDEFFAWRRTALLSIDIARCAVYGGIVFLLLFAAIVSAVQPTDNRLLIALIIGVAAIFGGLAVSIFFDNRAWQLSKSLMPGGRRALMAALARRGQKDRAIARHPKSNPLRF